MVFFPLPFWLLMSFEIPSTHYYSFKLFSVIRTNVDLFLNCFLLKLQKFAIRVDPGEVLVYISYYMDNKGTEEIFQIRVFLN